jgi:DNA topoisomerase-2
MADEVQNLLEKLENQARFIQMIVDKQLVVSNRKKADIVLELRQKKFTPFPRAAKKVKTAGEPGEDESADEEEGAETEGSNDYDYLLGMAIGSLTKEKVRFYREARCLTLRLTIIYLD